MQIPIATLDLNRLLQEILEGADPKEDLVPDKIKELVIVITGNKGETGFDHRTALALTSLQQSFYALTAQCLYGEHAQAGHLSEDELEDFKLVFAQDPDGAIKACVFKGFLKLCVRLFKDLKPGPKLAFALLATLAFVGHNDCDLGREYAAVLDSLSCTASKEKPALSHSQASEGQIKHLLLNVARAGEKCARDFAQALKGASELKFGVRSFTSEELAGLQKSKSKRSVKKELEDGAYAVKALDRTDPLVLRAVLQDLKSGEVFKAVYALQDSDDGDARALDDELILSLVTSLGKETAVRLAIAKRICIDEGKTLRAVIAWLSDEQLA